jgi:hypothetical protein
MKEKVVKRIFFASLVITIVLTSMTTYAYLLGGKWASNISYYVSSSDPYYSKFNARATTS